MKAVRQDRYGSSDVLEMCDVEQPTPGDGDVLVRIVAASVNPLDWHYMRGTPYFIRFQSGLRRPKQKYRPRGVDLAGVVEAVGPGVERFRVGDEVYGQRGGAFGEYKVVKESDVVRKPANISFEEAAAIPVAATTALQALRDKGKVQPGDHVLVNGAGGGVGTFAVQIAKALGATVTGVCSTQSVDLVRTLGADAVVDYTTEDFTTAAAPADVILDSVAQPAALGVPAGPHRERPLRQRRLGDDGQLDRTDRPLGEGLGGGCRSEPDDDVDARDHQARRPRVPEHPDRVGGRQAGRRPHV